MTFPVRSKHTLSSLHIHTIFTQSSGGFDKISNKKASSGMLRHGSILGLGRHAGVKRKTVLSFRVLFL